MPASPARSQRVHRAAGKMLHILAGSGGARRQRSEVEFRVVDGIGSIGRRGPADTARGGRAVRSRLEFGYGHFAPARRAMRFECVERRNAFAAGKKVEA